MVHSERHKATSHWPRSKAILPHLLNCHMYVCLQIRLLLKYCTTLTPFHHPQLYIWRLLVSALARLCASITEYTS